MKYMLPILAVASIAVLAATSTADRSSQPVTKKDVTTTPNQPPPPDRSVSPPSLPNGQELVVQAAQQLLVLPGLEAKTRQRVSVFNQQLVGSGSYSQLANGPRLLLRLDMKLKVGDGVASLLQVSDGDSLWIRSSLPSEDTLGRVNLRRLRTAASRSEVPIPPSYWMALGGMPHLLTRLNEHFLFQTTQATQIGNLPVWQLDGRWRPKQLAKMIPHRRKEILAGKNVPLADLSAHQPHGVTLILGRDQRIPLFPYGVSFYRNEMEDEGQGRALVRHPLVTLELFEVRFNKNLSPSQFEYRPGNQEIEERTDQFIARLGSAARSIK